MREVRGSARSRGGIADGCCGYWKASSSGGTNLCFRWRKQSRVCSFFPRIFRLASQFRGQSSRPLSHGTDEPPSALLLRPTWNVSKCFYFKQCISYNYRCRQLWIGAVAVSERSQLQLAISISQQRPLILFFFFKYDTVFLSHDTTAATYIRT